MKHTGNLVISKFTFFHNRAFKLVCHYDAVLHMFGTVLRRVPLFDSLTDNILADVCLELKAYNAAEGELFTR